MFDIMKIAAVFQEPEWYMDVNQRGSGVAGFQRATKRRAWLHHQQPCPDVVALVVTDFTRISRSVSEFGEIFTMLEEKGVNLVKAG